MSVDEASRRRLFDRLEEVLGVDDAATLMGHLPPGDWGEVATRRDVDQLGTELRTEMAATRHDLDHLGAQLRTEMQALRFELLAALHQEVAGALTAQTRMVIFTMAGTIALLGSLVIGILGLQ
jgi:hypothetical protein